MLDLTAQIFSVALHYLRMVVHGWMSATLFRRLDKVCWDQLADESSPYTVSFAWMYEQYMANHFVAARKGDPFIKKWYVKTSQII
jgi:hypothetical protein